MKRTVVLFMSFILLCFNEMGQQNPIQWSFSSKKISERTFEIHMKAIIAPAWRIYSQGTPNEGPIPTKITFTKSPLVLLEGKTREEGQMKIRHEEVFGVDIHFYNNSVDFIQIVKLKGEVKAKLAGTLEYMTCTDEQCLNPRTIPFSVVLQ
jgi:hypothetical protein